MHAIPFFPEVMEYLFISARIKLENRSKVVSSARGGYAENVSLLIQVQIGVRVCGVRIIAEKRCVRDYSSSRFKFYGQDLDADFNYKACPQLGP